MQFLTLIIDRLIFLLMLRVTEAINLYGLGLQDMYTPAKDKIVFAPEYSR